MIKTKFSQQRFKIKQSISIAIATLRLLGCKTWFYLFSQLPIQSDGAVAANQSEPAVLFDQHLAGVLPVLLPRSREDHPSGGRPPPHAVGSRGIRKEKVGAHFSVVPHCHRLLHAPTLTGTHNSLKSMISENLAKVFGT